jgi:hypothetical protein
MLIELKQLPFDLDLQISVKYEIAALALKVLFLMNTEIEFSGGMAIWTWFMRRLECIH